MSAPIVTLTTDFGQQDSFVGTMKGVVLSRCPEARIVDVCHEVPPQDVRRGALRLAGAAPYFPTGTVHVAVVDPGVGSERRALAVEANGQRFVGPDNGVLSLAAPRAAADWRAVALTRPEFWLPQVSNTFHGRDVFAPVAAYLASGGALYRLGDAVDRVVELDILPPRRADDVLEGVVIDVDRFGNLATNLTVAELQGHTVERVEVGGAVIVGLSAFYDSARPLVAVISSEGRLEVAVPSGSAAAQLGLTVDAPVRVHVRPAPRP